MTAKELARPNVSVCVLMCVINLNFPQNITKQLKHTLLWKIKEKKENNLKLGAINFFK